MLGAMLATLAAIAGGLDTLRLEVGSAAVNLDGMLPHEAKVTVERLVDGTWRPVVEWTNRLQVGDSAGIAVHRWTTIGTRPLPSGGTATWQLDQTFERRSIGLLGFRSTTSDGNETSYTPTGTGIAGTRRIGASGTRTPLEVKLSRRAFPAAASDLVPMGVALEVGLVMTLPVWQLGMPDVETRIFTVTDRRTTKVAGKDWKTWVVEERAVRDGAHVFLGTWYIADDPPYMVYAETVGPNGARQRMTEVLVEQKR